MVIDDCEVLPDGVASPLDDPAKGSLNTFLNVPALLAITFWSAVGPIAKYALDDFPELAYTAYRPVLAALLLFVFFRLRGESFYIAPEDRPRMLIAGIGGMGLSQMFYLTGLAHTSVTHNVVIVSTSPLLAVLFRAVFFRDLPDGRSLLGLAGGFAGVVVLVSAAGSGNGATLFGDLLSLGGAAAWVVATTLPAPLVPKYGSTRITAWLLVGAIVVTLPLGLAQIGDTLRDPPPLFSWLSLLYSTVFGMILANVLWQKAVHTSGSARTLAYLYLEPVGAIALAALFLGERLDAIQAVGAALALAGMMLVRRR